MKAKTSFVFVKGGPEDADLDFTIRDRGPISSAFIKEHCQRFSEAVGLVRKLPFGRNQNKLNLLSLFEERRGTCGTKHALLKQLAKENGIGEINLMCGIYRMTGDNTKAVAATLKKHGLVYIPEAHNYLRYKDKLIDATKSSGGISFYNDLLEETEMQPEQIGQYKIDHHKNFLKKWLLQYPDIPYNLEQLWHIRELCIKDLGDHTTEANLTPHGIQ